jgi:N-methylhydantoinase B/oxoprolinase/acetone carboxylase alpha subunit
MEQARDRTVDTVTREVLRHRFDAIADEMESALLRSAYSSIVKEAQDASAAVFDPQGRTVAQAVAIPAHLGMLIPAVESIVESFPPAEMRPGDVYAMNDPYDGGTHLPDVTVVRPVFHEGEVVALGASMAHHQEMGGKTPGSIPTDATDVYQEGFRFPPSRLYDAGEPNETLFAVLETNVRIPETVRGDLGAQVSACLTAERRLEAVAEEYGATDLAAAVDATIEHAETRTRHHLARIPDGVYSFHDHVDDDGIDHHEPVRIEASVTVDGSDLHVDFAGTDDQVTGPINAVPSATMSAVYYVVRAITDPAIPNNAGCFEPVSLHLPEGSLVNPRPPAPVNARTVTFKRIAEVLLGALAEAIPDRIPAAGSGQLAALTFAGGRADGDRPAWIYGETAAGGLGARPSKDGIDCIETDVTNCMNTPVEATEIEYPLRVERYDLWPDSGGAGRHRGGLGHRKRFRVLTDGVTFTHRRDRHDFRPWGLAGGEPAPTCRTEIRRADGDRERLPSKVVRELSRGDVVAVDTTGGGGYGDPTARPLADLRRDVRAGKVTPAGARAYGAVVEDGAVDWAATERSRDPADETGPATERATPPAVDRGSPPVDAADD